MSARDDIMKDYVPVNERIGAFLNKHPEGSLQSELVELSDTRVVMRAYAYRSPDDPRPGIGYSSLEIPGRTPYTRGSEVENAETSAWGRAIAALGFEVKRGIASAEEVANKSGPIAKGFVGTAADPAPLQDANGGLIGKVELAKDSPDFLPHIGPDGPVLSFKLVSSKGGIKVIAKGSMAEVIALAKEQTVGEQVTCWGRISDEPFTPKGTKKVITYQVLALERIKTPSYTLPAPDDALEEPGDDIELLGEAESAPLGLVS